MMPREPSSGNTWLDQMVRRFQDRWETDPQYRALVSGVVGLVLVVTLCACTGLLTLEGNTLLASVGLTNSSSGGNNITDNSGSATVAAGASFPTATFGPVYSSATPGVSTPVGTVQTSSLTPLPNATPSPSPTAAGGTPTGGGGNNATFVCTGSGSGITWTFSPCPLVHGQAGTLTISAPGYPNTGTNIIVNFGNCPKGDCTIDDPPGQGFQTNGSGVETISFVVAQDVQVGGPPVTGEINLSGGPTAGINTQGSCS